MKIFEYIGRPIPKIRIKSRFAFHDYPPQKMKWLNFKYSLLKSRNPSRITSDNDENVLVYFMNILVLYFLNCISLGFFVVRNAYF